MRNLDECRSEIFRLGKEKIKDRKKRRKHMIMACVPMCLCLAVAASMLPYVLKDDRGGVQVDSVVNQIPENIEQIVYLEVEIKGFGDASEINNQVDDPSKIDHIAKLIDDIYSKKINGSSGTLDEYTYGSENEETDTTTIGGVNDGTNGEMPDSPKNGYVISFKSATGHKLEYTLSGYVLKNNLTNETVFVTSSERTQLMFELTRTY